MRRVVVAVLAALGLSVTPTHADTDLTTLVNGRYGGRTVTVELHAIAHQRAEYQVAFSGGACEADGSLTHAGLVTVEVLACNASGPARAVEQWAGSPSHDAILSDKSLTAIGCASAPGLNGATFYVCALSAGPAPPTSAPTLVPGPAGHPLNVGGSGAQGTPLPAASPVLPNTAATR